MEKEKYGEALALARKAEIYIPTDRMLVNLWPKISWTPSIRTTPEGTDVYVKDYSSPALNWDTSAGLRLITSNSDGRSSVATQERRVPHTGGCVGKRFLGATVSVGEQSNAGLGPGVAGRNLVLAVDIECFHIASPATVCGQDIHHSGERRRQVQSSSCSGALARVGDFSRNGYHFRRFRLAWRKRRDNVKICFATCQESCTVEWGTV
jgi:hypothetical protein